MNSAIARFRRHRWKLSKNCWHRLLRDNRISPARVVGHSDIAPTRKQDPGELFDWKRLADKGLSIWPAEPGNTIEMADARRYLSNIGYDPDAPLADVVTAFQRRFVPAGVSGALDDKNTRNDHRGSRLKQLTLSAFTPNVQLVQTVGWPPFGNGETRRGEESPGSTETRCRLTAGGGDPRESATESKPPSVYRR